jgi:WD repeat-containing protein 19
LYFEKENNNFLAGKYYFMAASYQKVRVFLDVFNYNIFTNTIQKAIKLLIKNQPNPEKEAEAIELAVQCVGKANDESLTHLLIEYLMGDHDGMPKDAKYLFKLYLSLKQYVEAAKTAILIARQEQQTGNYRDAHDVLFGMNQDLVKEKIKIPFEVQQNLMLLHSYILVKVKNIQKSLIYKALLSLIDAKNKFRFK